MPQNLCSHNLKEEIQYLRRKRKRADGAEEAYKKKIALELSGDFYGTNPVNYSVVKHLPFFLLKN